MPFVDELQELESILPSYPFVSLYLDVGHSEKSAEEMRVFTRNQLRQALAETPGGRERNRLEKDSRHITAYLEDVIHARVQRKAQGIGIFSCVSQKYFQVVSSADPFPSQLHIGDRPHLQPLRERAQGLKQILAILLGANETRILELGPGQRVQRHNVHQDGTRKHSGKGWSQLRFRSCGDVDGETFTKEVARVLTYLSDQAPRVPVLVRGLDRSRKMLRDWLPARMLSRLVDTFPAAFSAKEHSTLQGILKNEYQMDAAGRDPQMESRLESAMAPNRGARGIAEVLRAANAHSVSSLFAPEDFDERGWKCRSCGALGAFVRLSCNYCGGNIESTDLRPDLEAKVLRGGGVVYAVPTSRNLTRGVVASLRYVR